MSAAVLSVFSAVIVLSAKLASGALAKILALELVESMQSVWSTITTQSVLAKRDTAEIHFRNAHPLVSRFFRLILGL